ncbi:hypothetical protein CcaverHIS002_0109600 [Cutaneotrichosporon cavernicola]|uniref:Uncharacterized protein n=1 Tax=Cutaneotrichosporon cavernicola TaxID=279322 RepID=A0AA48KXF6_9TREE|nr:uncharacterized protein CcaverHIS019_0109520 [Cutaneotrichosporon cavernicola]BEI80431.1 hypothetical protein CcaverHIS002_0109600 [Cutaneotrichosporon cavernicola]BEI88234.1 hypothetical protein CcaverHIS019_0109520 [Cutaneotrichosporon cavernicola]BEI96005.1 hypothetical protein CcaverHIS631_0109540 [Cutaneotrichosporon cavernicola]BEJ03779.1 hypothetical protein CcaverHIS641_0109540 [Cutaneotrichosporon cavernicola]
MPNCTGDDDGNNEGYECLIAIDTTGESDTTRESDTTGESDTEGESDATGESGQHYCIYCLTDYDTAQG